MTIQTMITENERLKRAVGILLICLVFVSVVGLFATHQAVKYHLLFDKEVVEHGACIASLKGGK